MITDYQIISAIVVQVGEYSTESSNVFPKAGTQRGVLKYDFALGLPVVCALVCCSKAQRWRQQEAQKNNEKHHNIAFDNRYVLLILDRSKSEDKQILDPLEVDYVSLGA